MDDVERIENGDLVLRIVQDDNVENPRTSWDNLATMVCWHPRYELGDIQVPRDQAQESHDEMVSEGDEVLPLYLYEHGGITMSTSGFSCGWDSGQVGFIYVSKAKIIEEFGDDSEASRENVRTSMIGEVETFDQYLTGAVYGFIVERKTGCDSCGNVEMEHVDSCFGFYGHDWEASGLWDTLDPSWGFDSVVTA